MKFSSIIILAAAALGGYAVYQSRLASTRSDDSSGPSDSSSGGGFYSDVMGPGSIGQTYHAANEERLSNGQGTSRYRNKNANGLNQSAPVDEVIENDMPLIDASAKGDVKKVEDRIAHQARVDSRDGLRRTALMYASWNNHTDICERLLAAGANPEFKDRDGNNAFDFAAGRGLTDMVNFLLSHTHTTDDGHYMEYAQLIQAAYFGNVAAMPAGTGKLASINRINPEGQSPLHMAAGNGSTAVIEMLVARGADVNIANNERQTPLLWAAWNNQAQSVDLLIRYKADMSKTDLGGNTPLMMAALNNSIGAAKVLIGYGADKYVSNKQGKTAAIIAEDKGYKELASLLK